MGRRSRGSSGAAAASASWRGRSSTRESCNNDLIGTGPFKLGQLDRQRPVRRGEEPELLAQGRGRRAAAVPRPDHVQAARPTAERALERARERRLRRRSTRRARSQIERDPRAGRSRARSTNVESDEFAEVGYTMFNATKAAVRQHRSPARRSRTRIDRETINKIRARRHPDARAAVRSRPGVHRLPRGHRLPRVRPRQGEGAASRSTSSETGKDLDVHADAPGRPGRRTQTRAVVQQLLSRTPGIKVNLKPVADQSALINDAIGGEFQAVGVAEPPRRRPRHAVRVVALRQLRRGTGGLRQPGQLRPVQRPGDQQGCSTRAATTADPAQAHRDLRGHQQASSPSRSGTCGRSTRSGRSPVQPERPRRARPDRCPTAAAPFPGLATGHPVSGMWVTQ